MGKGSLDQCDQSVAGRSVSDGIPHHVAIIMDGNGRWAQQRGLPRVAGHQAGVETVRRVVRACAEIGIRVLTLYTFSTENWRRPEAEVAFLMGLCERYAQREVAELRRNGVRLNVIGRRTGLPPSVLAALDQAMEETRDGDRLLLNLALNYGGRAEIVDATRAVMVACQRGELDPDALNEVSFHRYLYTAGLPDPDLVIRTAGEMRLSNFLIWQVVGAVFWTTPIFWPDFDKEHLLQAIRDYQEIRRETL
ncbi:MAG: isoprenyl transferase [Chloroflexi bacterium]|nr:isoprenyl transferase [Chloroflexota bacterium]